MYVCIFAHICTFLLDDKTKSPFGKIEGTIPETVSSKSPINDLSSILEKTTPEGEMKCFNFNIHCLFMLLMNKLC